MRFRLSRTSGDPELRRLQCNYLLNPVNTFSLFDEFMEMSTWGGWGHRPDKQPVPGQVLGDWWVEGAGTLACGAPHSAR